MSNAWRQVVASLADAGRLNLYAAVVTSAAGLAPLRREDLSTDQRRRLAPLVAAGLVRDDDGALAPVPARFADLLAAAAADDGPEPADDDPTRFLTAGRVLSLPRRREDRDRLLRYVGHRVLPLQEPVAEPVLMERLAALAADPVGLRRELVDAGVLLRTRDGSSYWRSTVTEFDGV